MECLESACIKYLRNQAHNLEQTDLLSLAKLGDHLGLAALCETSAEALVQFPWESSISQLAEVIQMPVYKLDAGKKDKLLHNAKRGAYSEIQVLELLEHIGTPESEIAQTLQIASMQPAELHVLVRILSSPDRTPGPLLQIAVQQHVTPLSMRTEINWNTCTHFINDIMRPTSSDWEMNYPLPKSECYLWLYSSVHEGKAF